MTQPPEVYGYNMIYDSHFDILNQDSIEYIHDYFDQKQKQQDQTESLTAVELQIKSNDSIYNVNSIGFVIKIIIFMIFLLILWNFINSKNN